jgi:nucleoside-diphosphate-sugar epimerase
MSLRIFVSGGTGFVGSHVAKRLISDGHEVVVLVRDVLPSPWANWLNEALKGTVYVRGDVLDFTAVKRVLAEYEIEWCMHLAAQAVVRKAMADPLNTFNVNIIGTVNVLEACRQLNTPKVLIMNTDKIFGERLNVEAEDPVVAGGVYETSKACACLIAESYRQTYGMKIVTPQVCNIYGYDLSPRIIPNTIISCLKNEPPIIFEGEKTLRQYIYVEDVCEALLHLMSGNHVGRFNICGNDILTQEEVVQTIVKNFFPHLKPKYVKREKLVKEIQQQSLKPSNFGWRPKYKFMDGIRETIEKFKKYGYWN